jgi:hypothetical protein
MKSGFFIYILRNELLMLTGRREFVLLALCNLELHQNFIKAVEVRKFMYKGNSA